MRSIVCLFVGAFVASAGAADFRPSAKTGAAIQDAINAAAETGGGRVVVEAGEYPCGSIQLKSHVELHLAEGAHLVGSTNVDDYVDIPLSVTRITPENSAKALFYGWDLTDVAITGKGVIDGRGPFFFDRQIKNSRFWPKPPIPRPRQVELVNCRGIRLSGVTFKDSPGWTMLIRLCEDLTVEGISIDCDQRMINSDGIDIDGCRNVRITKSRFKTGDDCLILRAIQESGREVVCENILVEDCTLDSACQTIRIGCPSDAVIRQATFRRITASGFNGINFDYPVHYLRADDEGSADISDILFEDYRGTFAHQAIRIAAGPGVKIRGVQNITFRNCEVTSEWPLLFWGNVDSVLSDIRLENVCATVKANEPVYKAQAVEPLIIKNCTFNGEKIAGRRVMAPRGVRQPLIKGKVASRIGTTCRLVREDRWYGYRRIIFDFQGEEAWVVLPKNENVPRDVPYTWTMEWPTAFVRRTGALAMLERGWPHVTIRPGHFESDGKTFVHQLGNMNDARIARCHAFQTFLLNIGFSPKATLIGMSWGGFYSIRYASAHPECVARVYLDAPLCDFTSTPNWWEGVRQGCLEIYGVTRDYVGKDDPRMPVNQYEAMARGGVEVLLLYGGSDTIVPPEKNCERWMKGFLACGGKLQNGILDEEGRGRKTFGHHPHGLEVDQQDKLVEFFEHGVPATKQTNDNSSGLSWETK